MIELEMDPDRDIARASTLQASLYFSKEKRPLQRET
jgi:hypothetical protein